MSTGWMGRTQEAICESLCAELAGGPQSLDRRVAAETSQWVAAQIGRMPTHYLVALRLLVAGFWLLALPSGGVFHRLPQARRSAILARWRRGPVAPMRDFVKLFESLCTLGYFSRLAAAEAPAG